MKLKKVICKILGHKSSIRINGCLPARLHCTRCELSTWKNIPSEIKRLDGIIKGQQKIIGNLKKDLNAKDEAHRQEIFELNSKCTSMRNVQAAKIRRLREYITNCVLIETATLISMESGRTGGHGEDNKRIATVRNIRLKAEQVLIVNSQ